MLVLALPDGRAAAAPAPSSRPNKRAANQMRCHLFMQNHVPGKAAAVRSVGSSRSGRSKKAAAASVSSSRSDRSEKAQLSEKGGLLGQRVSQPPQRKLSSKKKDKSRHDASSSSGASSVSASPKAKTGVLVRLVCDFD